MSGEFRGSVLGVFVEPEAALLGPVEASHDSAAHLEGLVLMPEFDTAFEVVDVGRNDALDRRPGRF